MAKLQSKWAIKTRATCFGFVYALVVLGCNSTPPQSQVQSVTRAIDEAAVRKADADWSAAAQANQVDT